MFSLFRLISLYQIHYSLVMLMTYPSCQCQNQLLTTKMYHMRRFLIKNSKRLGLRWLIFSCIQCDDWCLGSIHALTKFTISDYIHYECYQPTENSATPAGVNCVSFNRYPPPHCYFVYVRIYPIGAQTIRHYAHCSGEINAPQFQQALNTSSIECLWMSLRD